MDTLIRQPSLVKSLECKVNPCTRDYYGELRWVYNLVIIIYVLDILT